MKAFQEVTNHLITLWHYKEEIDMKEEQGSTEVFLEADNKETNTSDTYSR